MTHRVETLNYKKPLKLEISWTDSSSVADRVSEDTSPDDVHDESSWIMLWAMQLCLF